MRGALPQDAADPQLAHYSTGAYASICGKNQAQAQSAAQSWCLYAPGAGKYQQRCPSCAKSQPVLGLRRKS